MGLVLIRQDASSAASAVCPFKENDVFIKLKLVRDLVYFMWFIYKVYLLCDTVLGTEVNSGKQNRQGSSLSGAYIRRGGDRH